jgi:hypothetical protein
MPPPSDASLAIFRNESILRGKLEPGWSERCFPNSQLKMHPFGAFTGSGGTGSLTSGNLCLLLCSGALELGVESLSHAPWPFSAEYVVSRTGAYITPIIGSPARQKAMETQKRGKRWE